MSIEALDGNEQDRPLPEFDHRVTDEGLLAVLDKAIEARHNSRATFRTAERERLSSRPGSAEIAARLHRTATVVGGQALAVFDTLDSLVPRSDGLSWRKLADETETIET